MPKNESLYKLKDSVIIKDNAEGGVLVLDLTGDQMYNFRGDVSLLILHLLKIQGNKKNEISAAEIQKYLLKSSPDFKKNKNQEKAVQEALDYLVEIQLVHEQR